MRIGCLQFAPQVGDVDNNLNRADAVLSRANPEGLDLLVLPELAFSGYNFKSLQDITPFLEPSGSGITSLWARTIALKYNCTVTVGYPEKVDVSPKWPTGPEYYNSLIVVNGDGETIANYRKSFLYYTDETWALEGKGFYDGFIPGLGRTSIGICMDINPYKFEAPWHAFEFAFHILEVESNLVIVSMAWMTREEPRFFTRMPNEPDMETLTYWVTRLEPLIRSDNEDEIVVVFCNRSGNEDEAMYAGTSAVIGIHEGEVKVYGLLGRGEKELLVVDTSNSPYAKLVYRPDAGGSGMEAPGKLKRTDNSNRGNNSKSNDNNQSSSSSSAKPSGEDKDAGNSATSPQDSVKTLQRRASSSTRCTLPKEEEKPQKKRHIPSSITIPSAVPDLVNTTSACSPSSASINIPTPSAPSPTPMAVRPRLIIPESPPILPHQYPPDHPMSAASLKSEKSERSVRSIRPRLIIPESPPILPHQYPADVPISAASLRSERSVRSLNSNFSDASGTTVRSNPRPPEESTPYPDSANPLSGYPSNAFQSERRVYDGHMTVAGPDDGVTPSFNFNDRSPTSPRRFWRPSDTPLRSPLSAAWTPGTAIGRKPEPFPWPDIINKDAPTLATKASKEFNKMALSPNELKTATPHSAQSNASSNRTHRTAISEFSELSKSVKKPSSKPDDNFDRPSSPKSRNASRSGIRDRAEPTLEVGEISTAITQHLEGISRRAESMSRLRSRSANRTPMNDRSHASKSRHGSRSRPDSATKNQTEHHMIPVAVSPSILWNEAQQPSRSSSRPGYHSRSQSFNNINAVLHASNGERSRTPVATASPQQTKRRTSRGRAQEPKVAPTNAMYGPIAMAAERASSSDSTRNQVLHSRTRTKDRNSRTRKSSSGRHGRTPSQTAMSPEMAAEFERVEVVVSPSCLVHGRSSSNAARHSDYGAPANNLQLPTKLSPTSPSGKSDSAAFAARVERLQLADLGDNIESYYLMGNGINIVEKPAAEKTLQVLKTDIAEASDSGSLAGTLQTLSTPGRSPATPASYFNPSTPKAMVLKTDDSDVDYFPNGHLNGVAQADPVRVS
ncbi:CN hydrolase domain-containing protein [Fusarium sp. LHS14.1]|nr:CN hydrolase domain-containing protein [Fusarium sp. LHS14.1]